MNKALPNNPDELKKLCINQHQRIRELEEILRLMRHNRFGRSSEKMDYSVLTPLITEESEDTELVNEQETAGTEETEDVKPYRRKVRRKRFPDFLEREEIRIDLEDKTCSDCHSEMHSVSEKISEKIHVIPARIVVKKTIRPVYSCRSCEQMKNAPLPYHPITKCMATPETLAQIVTAKYADGLPLYRQEQIYKRAGIDISRDNMSRWIIQLANKVNVVHDLCHQKLLEGGRVGMDETRLQVNKEKDRDAHQKSYMIVQAREGPPGQCIAIFHYEPSRAAAVISKYLKDFKGSLVTDGLDVYQKYSSLHPLVVHGGCWSHSRRKFDEAVKGSKRKKNSVAQVFLEKINLLFKIERKLSGLPKEEVLAKRQELSKPVLDEMDELLTQKITSIPSKSLTGKALGYLSNQWPYLTSFLNQPDLPIHNNWVENQIRPFVLGRKAWLFADSVDGAHASAIFYSLVTTAKLNGLNPFDYLCKLFLNLESHSAEELLPFKI